VYSLLCKFGLVLIFDADFLKTSEFFGFDALDLLSLVLKTLPHFTSFFEVVEAVLFGLLSVITNLRANGGGMVAQVLLLLFIDEAFLFLSTFVLFDDAEERIALEFSLLTEHFFALAELSLAGNVEILGRDAFLFGLCNFLGTFSALALFESTLLSQGVNLSLTISCAFLKVTEPFYFKLFLILEFLLLSKLSFDGSALLGLVGHNLLVFILFHLHFIGFPVKRNAVGF